MPNNTDVNVLDLPKEKINRLFYNYRNLFYIKRKNGLKESIKYLFHCFNSIIKVLFCARDSRFKRAFYIVKGLVYFANPFTVILNVVFVIIVVFYYFIIFIISVFIASNHIIKYCIVVYCIFTSYFNN